MNLPITMPVLTQDLRDLIRNAAETVWRDRYREPFPAQWEITSVNFVGDMIDVTFSWNDPIAVELDHNAYPAFGEWADD